MSSQYNSDLINSSSHSHSRKKLEQNMSSSSRHSSSNYIYPQNNSRSSKETKDKYERSKIIDQILIPEWIVTKKHGNLHNIQQGYKHVTGYVNYIAGIELALVPILFHVENFMGPIAMQFPMVDLGLGDVNLNERVQIIKIMLSHSDRPYQKSLFLPFMTHFRSFFQQATIKNYKRDKLVYLYDEQSWSWVNQRLISPKFNERERRLCSLAVQISINNPNINKDLQRQLVVNVGYIKEQQFVLQCCYLKYFSFKHDALGISLSWSPPGLYKNSLKVNKKNDYTSSFFKIVLNGFYQYRQHISSRRIVLKIVKQFEQYLAKNFGDTPYFANLMTNKFGKHLFYTSLYCILQHEEQGITSHLSIQILLLVCFKYQATYMLQYTMYWALKLGVQQEQIQFIQNLVSIYNEPSKSRYEVYSKTFLSSLQMVNKGVWDSKTQLAVFVCVVVEPSQDPPLEFIRDLKNIFTPAGIIYFINVYCMARYLTSWTKYFGYETIDYYVLEHINNVAPELLNYAHLCCRIEDKELWKLRMTYK